MRQAEASVTPESRAAGKRVMTSTRPARPTNAFDDLHFTARGDRSAPRVEAGDHRRRQHGPFPDPSLRAFFGRPGALAHYLGQAQAAGRRLIRLLVPLLLLVPGGAA